MGSYYEDEVKRLTSKEHATERLKKQTSNIKDVIDFLIIDKNIDNIKTREIQDTIKLLETQVKEFIDDPWNGFCPYNDPTLDHDDPYYMKPPFGKSPEELAEMNQARHRSGSETLMGCIRQSTNNPLNREQDDN